MVDTVEPGYIEYEGDEGYDMKDMKETKKFYI